MYKVIPIEKLSNNTKLALRKLLDEEHEEQFKTEIKTSYSPLEDAMDSKIRCLYVIEGKKIQEIATIINETNEFVRKRLSVNRVVRAKQFNSLKRHKIHN